MNDKPKNSFADMKKALDAARRRREKYEKDWQQYALLHAKSYVVRPAENDDESVVLPNGDQVRLSLVHRNVEQTLAALEASEIGVRAILMDTTNRQEGYEDTHKEAIVEQALVNSSRCSGLLKGISDTKSVSDAVKLDAIIIGHGISYTWWREEKTTVTKAQPALEDIDDEGTLIQVIDQESGEPLFEDIEEESTEWEGVKDEHVPVLEFLFDASAKSIGAARWYAREQICSLEDLRKEGRYDIPDDVKGGTYQQKDLYGYEPDNNAYSGEEWVKKITLWDKRDKKLRIYLECAYREKPSSTKPEDRDLLLILESEWPVMFSHPDASPFSVFVPIPANDHPFGISQIEHIRNAATEADKTRSRQANAVRQIKRITIYDKTLIDESELSKALASPDFAIVGIKPTEGIKDLSTIIYELPVPSIHPDTYHAADMAAADVRNISGVSDIPLGGANTATESENLTQVGQARLQRKRRFMLDWYANVLQRHCDYLAAFGPEGKSILVQDIGGKPVRLVYGREAFQGRWDIKVLPSGGAFGLSPVQQKTMLELAGSVFQKFGPEFDRAFLGVLLEKFDIPNAQRLLSAIPIVQQPQPPSAVGPMAPEMNLNDYTDAQSIRAGINALNEG